MFGCIADDVTGATDVAAVMARTGVRVEQFLGIPGEGDHTEADAVVIALKTRTIDRDEAVKQSLDAAEWLIRHGAKHLYFKYCSTFDSSATGNIGPVAAALGDRMQADRILFCPAFPENGRTVYNGHLFVGDLLISDTGMAHHPLTPMTDPNLIRVLTPQVASAPVANLPMRTISAGAEAIAAFLSDAPRYIIADTIADADMDTLAAASVAAALPFSTGGSAFAGHLVEAMSTPASRTANAIKPTSQTRTAILAGSCSEATRQQIAIASKSLKVIHLDAEAISRDPSAADQIVEEAQELLASEDVIIASSASPEELGKTQSRLGAAAAGELVEQAFAHIASSLALSGTRSFIVAGGETSGAVAKALKIRRLTIGPEIAPGVPWIMSADDRSLALAFKSGNFGAETFFLDALSMLQGGHDE